jgi:hypothetical protein
MRLIITENITLDGVVETKPFHSGVVLVTCGRR